MHESAGADLGLMELAVQWRGYYLSRQNQVCMEGFTRVVKEDR